MTPAFEVGRYDGRGAVLTLADNGSRVPYQAAFNVTGQPAVTVPAGLTGDRLPVAVQLVGRLNDEATLLSLSAQIEAERPWAQLTP